MILLYWFMFCLICGIVKSVSGSIKQRKAIKEQERLEMLRRVALIEQYQAKQRREIARRQAEVDREFARQRKEQERQAREQEKQAAQLERHERRLDDLRQRMKQAETDIDFLTERIGNLDAQRDSVLLRQSTLVPGSKEFEKCQSKIISLDSQIHAAETRLNKAQHTRRTARAELTA